MRLIFFLALLLIGFFMLHGIIGRPSLYSASSSTAASSIQTWAGVGSSIVGLLGACFELYKKFKPDTPSTTTGTGSYPPVPPPGKGRHGQFYLDAKNEVFVCYTDRNGQERYQRLPGA